MSDTPGGGTGGGGVQVGGGYVRIGVDRGPLQTGMDQAGRSFEKHLQGMSGMASQWALTMGRTLGAALGIGGIVGAAVTGAQQYTATQQTEFSLSEIARRSNMPQKEMEAQREEARKNFADIGHMTTPEMNQLMAMAIQVRSQKWPIQEFFKAAVTLAAVTGRSAVEEGQAVFNFLRGGGANFEAAGFFAAPGEDPRTTEGRFQSMIEQSFERRAEFMRTNPAQEFRQTKANLWDKLGGAFNEVIGALYTGEDKAGPVTPWNPPESGMQFPAPPPPPRPLPKLPTGKSEYQEYMEEFRNPLSVAPTKPVAPSASPEGSQYESTRGPQGELILTLKKEIRELNSTLQKNNQATEKNTQIMKE